MTRDERIRHEREHFNLKPWEFAPSEIDDGPSPYGSTSVGTASWLQARRLRSQIKAKHPDYFDEE